MSGSRPFRCCKWQACLLTLVMLISVRPLAATEEDLSTLPKYERIRVLAEARQISDAELRDQNGDLFQLGQLKNRVVLILFGFTSCPDVCPTALQKLVQLIESSNSLSNDVTVVMISVDGERDTPSAMKKYLNQFSPRFIGLTGDPKKVRPIAAEFSSVFFKGSPSGENGSYSVSHSQQVYAIDQQGLLRAEFHNASIDAMDGFISELLGEERPN